MTEMHPEVELGNHVDLLTGFPFKSERFLQSSSDGVRLLRGDNVGQGVVRWEGVKRWPVDELTKFEAFQLREQDVVLAMDRPWIEAGLKYASIAATDVPSLLVQRVARMRGANGLSTAYLRYVIGSKSFTDHVKSITTGVNVPHISAKDIKRYRLPLPPMDVQRQTAEILGFYDALIELNRRRITMLEEIARCLFEEWFVQLRFPGHEQAPRKETTHGPIPQAWRLDSLGTTLSTLESGSRPLGGIQVLPEGVPSIGAENIKGLGNYDYRKERLVTRAYFESMRRGVIQSGDVLLYKDGAYIGRMALFRDGYPYSDCAVNEHVFILRPRAPMSSAYLYFWLSQGKLLATMRGMNTNAAQPGLNQATVRSLPIVVPSEDILDAFSRLVDPILGALFCYAKANRLLDVARDLLLPRLVSAGLSLGAAKLALGGVD